MLLSNSIKVDALRYLLRLKCPPPGGPELVVCSVVAALLASLLGAIPTLVLLALLLPLWTASSYAEQLRVLHRRGVVQDLIVSGNKAHEVADLCAFEAVRRSLLWALPMLTVLPLVYYEQKWSGNTFSFIALLVAAALCGCLLALAMTYALTVFSLPGPRWAQIQLMSFSLASGIALPMGLVSAEPTLMWRAIGLTFLLGILARSLVCRMLQLAPTQVKISSKWPRVGRSSNPIIRRHQLSGPASSQGAGFVAFVLLLALWLGWLRFERDLIPVLIGLLGFVVYSYALAAFHGFHLVSDEKTQRTLGPLRSTLLRPDEVVWAWRKLATGGGWVVAILVGAGLYSIYPTIPIEPRPGFMCGSATGVCAPLTWGQVGLLYTLLLAAPTAGAYHGISLGLGSEAIHQNDPRLSLFGAVSAIGAVLLLLFVDSPILVAFFDLATFLTLCLALVMTAAGMHFKARALQSLGATQASPLDSLSPYTQLCLEAQAMQQRSGQQAPEEHQLIVESPQVDQLETGAAR